MEKLLKIAVILCLTFVSRPTLAQSDLYQLAPGKNSFSLGIGITDPSSSRTTAIIPSLAGVEFNDNDQSSPFRLPEDQARKPGHSEILFGTANFGVSSTIEFFVGAGVEFVEESLSDIVIRPAPSFNVGFGSSQPIGKTQFHYFAEIGFGMEFAQIVNDNTDADLGDMRLAMLKGSVGVARKIKTDFLTFSPFVAISNTYTWLNMHDDIADLTKSDSIISFASKVGLDIEISPKISLIGSTVFSERNSASDTRVYLSFHPEAFAE